MHAVANRRFAAVALTAVFMLGACSGDQSPSPPATPDASPPSSPTGSSEPTSTAASMFGSTIESYPTTLADPEWVEWDPASCEFKPAVAPYAGPYVVDLRGPGSFDGLVGWAPQDTQTDNVVLANNSFDVAAEKAGMRLHVISNEFPDQTQPIVTAQDMVVAQPDLVLSMNSIAPLQERIFSIYKEACIPALAFSVGPPAGVPWIAASWEGAAETAAEAVASYVASAGWPPADISVLVCTSSAFVRGSGPGATWDVFRDVLLGKISGISEAQVTELDCTAAPGSNNTEASQRTTRDWLTANPDAEYIVTFGGPDIFGFGMYNALDSAGKASQAAFGGIGLTAPVRALMLSGLESYFSVDFGLFYFGPYGLGVAQDVLDGRPIPIRIIQPTQAVDHSTIRDVLAERGTTE